MRQTCPDPPPQQVAGQKCGLCIPSVTPNMLVSRIMSSPVLLQVSFNQHLIPIELSTSAGKRRIVVDGREIRWDWLALPDGRYSIIADGRVFDLSVDVGRESCTVVSRDASHLLRLIDGRRHGPENEA